MNDFLCRDPGARWALLAFVLTAGCGGPTRAGDAPAPHAGTGAAATEAHAAVHGDQTRAAVRAELERMGTDDQAVRSGMTPASLGDTAFLGRMMRTDSARSRRLQEIVDRHGWPDAARFGRDAERSAFLIVQHTPFDAFREAMLPHVEASVRAGRLDAHDFAAMVDRVRTHRGRPQLYGSQYELIDGALVRSPVEDPDNLAARRSGLGLMPIEEYERLLSEHYGAPVRR